MLATILATARLLREVASAIADPATRGTTILTVFALAIGTAFYSSAEGWSAVDALYFSVTTLTTIGYGDLAPTSDVTKLFTVAYSIIGLGLMASLVAAIALQVTSRSGRRSARLRRGTGRAENS